MSSKYENVTMLTGSAPPLSTSDRLYLGTHIAVHVHLFHIELVEEMLEAVNKIPFPFDCYISTDAEDKKETIEKSFLKSCNAQNVHVQVFPNRGRDIGPFLWQMGPVCSDYEYICHIHTKKSCHIEYGDFWRGYLLKNLLGSEEFVGRIFDRFEDNDKLGMVFPSPYPVLEDVIRWNPETEMMKLLEKRAAIALPLEDMPAFSAGTMFWARTNAIRDVFALGFTSDDFPSEDGQIEGTAGHALERAFPCFVLRQGYEYELIQNAVFNEKESKRKLIVFDCSSSRDKSLGSEDLYTLQSLRSMNAVVVVLIPPEWRPKDLKNIEQEGTRVVKMSSSGSMGSMRAYGEFFLCENREYWLSNEFEQIVLVDNSCIGPIFPLDEVFLRMEERGVDFWGLCVGEIQNAPKKSKDYGEDETEESGFLQSNFLVFNRNVFLSSAFIEEWQRTVKGKDDKQLISKNNYYPTARLSHAGFTYGAYIQESAYIPEALHSDCSLEELGYEYALLGMPLIAKGNKLRATRERRQALRQILEQLSLPSVVTGYFKENENKGFLSMIKDRARALLS